MNVLDREAAMVVRQGNNRRENIDTIALEFNQTYCLGANSETLR